MRIKQIWDELANNNDRLNNRFLYRRYSAEIRPDVYVALQQPENFLCIYILIRQNTELNIQNFTNLREIQVEMFPSPNEAEKKILIFKLLNFEHKDIFAVLCEDLIVSIAQENDEQRIIRKILSRFEKWKSLFNKIGFQGLNEKAQRGLFGELYFLRKFLQAKNDFVAVVKTWVGAEKQIRDFQSGSWAVEVKTTHGNNHQKVHISSERQLDTSNLDSLFLYHISLEQQQSAGETLNNIVDSIVDILRVETIALNLFKIKIYEFGYFDFQRNLYEMNGYHIRQNVFYKVEKDFPRIEESDLRNGVGDVKYSIILAQCATFSISEFEVFNTITP